MRLHAGYCCKCDTAHGDTNRLSWRRVDIIQEHFNWNIAFMHMSLLNTNKTHRIVIFDCIDTHQVSTFYYINLILQTHVKPFDTSCFISPLDGAESWVKSADWQEFNISLILLLHAASYCDEQNVHHNLLNFHDVGKKACFLFMSIHLSSNLTNVWSVLVGVIDIVNKVNICQCDSEDPDVYKSCITLRTIVEY